MKTTDNLNILVITLLGENYLVRYTLYHEGIYGYILHEKEENVKLITMGGDKLVTRWNDILYLGYNYETARITLINYIKGKIK